MERNIKSQGLDGLQSDGGPSVHRILSLFGYSVAIHRNSDKLARRRDP
jgi:hypothetical protein